MAIYLDNGHTADQDKGYTADQAIEIEQNEYPWQYKIVESLRPEPEAVQAAFERPEGWFTLGPSASARCQMAWEDPFPGRSCYMTLSPMCSYKMCLVGANPLGLTFVRHTETKECRLLAKPVKKLSCTYSLTLEPVAGKPTCLNVTVHSLGGNPVAVYQKKKNTVWRDVKDIRYGSGFTDNDWVEFLLGTTRLTKRFAAQAVGDSLTKPTTSKGVRKAISKKA